MPDVAQFRIGETEGGAVLLCPDCGQGGWFSGYIGGETVAQVAARAAKHNAEKHASIDLSGYAAPVEFTDGEPHWPTR